MLKKAYFLAWASIATTPAHLMPKQLHLGWVNIGLVVLACSCLALGLCRRP